MSENAFIDTFQVPVSCLGYILGRTAMGPQVVSIKTVDQQFFCFLVQWLVLNHFLCWFSVAGLNQSLFFFLPNFAHAAMQMKSLCFFSLSAVYLLPLLSLRPAAHPDLASISSLGLCCCKVLHREPARFLGLMCAVFLYCAEPEEEKSDLLSWSGGLCPDRDSFHSRFITAPCPHACKKVTDLTDFLSVHETNIKIPKGLSHPNSESD